MQIVTKGDNLHEISYPVFWKKQNKKNINIVSSAERAQTVVMLKYSDNFQTSLSLVLV